MSSLTEHSTAIAEILKARGETVAVAETSAGGLVSAQLLAVPGASAYFLGSIVSYSDAFKEHFLKVPHSLLQKKGSVSQEAVIAMAKNLLEDSDADYAIAVSGRAL